MSITASKKTEREVEIVLLDDLGVDLTYQRPLDQRLVEAILREYDPIAADPLTISKRRDGSLWIVNGQHEAAAAKLAGETEMLAFVYEGLTVRQEADLRLKKNNRRADTPLERFHAQVVAGNEESLAIQALLEQFGTVVNRTNSRWNGINAVAVIERLYRWDDGITLGRTLQMIRDGFGELHGEAVTGTVLQAVAWFLSNHPNATQYKDMLKRMQTYGVDDLQRKARSHKAVAGGSMWLNFYRAMVEVYNHRRGEAARIIPVYKYTRGQTGGSPSDWR